jgi:5-methyltetrahydrofolate--homocysteine methyltransferase
MPHILDYLADRVLLCDGAMGTEVQAQNLDIVRDFHNHENCTEILCESRPDLVRDIHRAYLAAGSDAIQTNSFGGSPITLNEFGIAEKAFALNKTAAELAHEAIAEFAHDGRPRFVFGSLGPGTRLPSLGHVAYQPLEDALTRQCAGLVEGGVDAILIETCQDPLQIKAAVNGAKRARITANKDIPIFVQVTVETTGTLLVGADIAAAATIIDALGVDALGLNCATGPREMAEHVKWLGENWPRLISVQPNAGLPELVSGRTQYPLTPEELAQWLERFVLEDGANIIGGCCGTEPRHIAALDAMLRRIGRLALQPGDAAPGERLSVDRRALQRQRLARLPPAAGSGRLGRLRRDGTRAGQGRLAHARFVHCVCRSGRDRRHDGDGDSHARCGQRAAGRRLDRVPGARSGAAPLWRQADHQLDQLRGRRGGGA